MIKKRALASSAIAALLLTAGCLPHHGMIPPNDGGRIEQHQTPGRGNDAGRRDNNARQDQFHRQDESRPQNAPGSSGARFDNRGAGNGRR